MYTERSRSIIKRYIETHPLELLAEDAVYMLMVTGEQYIGKDEITAMMNYLYQIAFNARNEVMNLIADGNTAVCEF